jgi:triosephosphate isomerase
MARTKFVAGNWKMNTSKASAVELAKAVAKGAPGSGVETGVAPPFVYLDAVGQAIAGSSVLLGAQDAYFEKNGAFTGEISIEMLKDLVVQAQLEEINPEVTQDPQRLVIAYEPVWAIGTGRNATDAQAQEVHAFIRDFLGKRWNKDFADKVRIQYGGSMKPENARGLLTQPDVDGGLIGGASLKPDSFLAIVNAAK